MNHRRKTVLRFYQYPNGRNFAGIRCAETDKNKLVLLSPLSAKFTAKGEGEVADGHWPSAGARSLGRVIIIKFCLEKYMETILNQHF
jgi:hypothetical protein